MKKITYIILIVITVFSCKMHSTDEKETEETKLNNTPKDSTVVNDKDENGCLISAGYIWSKVNNECVKVFTGIQLNPVDKKDIENETISAYILFSEDKKKAEVFLPNDTTSMVLNRAHNNQPWVLDNWKLIKSNGFTLKKGTETKFVGDGEIGKKVSGTHTE